MCRLAEDLFSTNGEEVGAACSCETPGRTVFDTRRAASLVEVKWCGLTSSKSG